MIIGTDPLDGAQRPRSEAGTRPVGDAEVHRNAEDRHLQIAEIGIFRRNRQIGRTDECRHTGIGRQPRPGFREDLVSYLAECFVEYLAALGITEFCPQRL